MIQLPNGCYCSNPTVNPENWFTGGKSLLQKNWYIQYYFHDSRFRDDPKYKYGKLVIVKGMNKFKTLSERREATARLLENELALLKNEGYNPITLQRFTATASLASDIPGQTPLCRALELAKQKLICEQHTIEDIDSMLRYINPAATALQLDVMPVDEIRQKHIKLILEQCGKMKESFSGHRFNKYRSYLMILFKELLQLESISANPVKDIAKQKTVKRIRKTLTDKDRKRIEKHLKKKSPQFLAFLNIFFHSGGRLTELMHLKAKDVDLKRQRYTCIVKKGKNYREVERTIKNVILPLWKKQLKNSGREDYVFSAGLLPGPKAIRTEQITRRWHTHVKKDLNITADFYSLKHLNTDETAALLSLEDAAAHNSHASTVITMKHYAIGEKERQHERLKKVGNRFA